jgi:hypothetical protein
MNGERRGTSTQPQIDEQGTAENGRSEIEELRTEEAGSNTPNLGVLRFFRGSSICG